MSRWSPCRLAARQRVGHSDVWFGLLHSDALSEYRLRRHLSLQLCLAIFDLSQDDSGNLWPADFIPEVKIGDPVIGDPFQFYGGLQFTDSGRGSQMLTPCLPVLMVWARAALELQAYGVN